MSKRDPGEGEQAAHHGGSGSGRRLDAIRGTGSEGEPGDRAVVAARRRLGQIDPASRSDPLCWLSVPRCTLDGFLIVKGGKRSWPGSTYF
jgi:hypothetical protein